MAAVDWLNKNQSIAVGFKLEAYDGGISEQDCAAVAKVISLN